jgi:hypothetical protein
MFQRLKFNVYISHEILYYKEWPFKPGDNLILLVRDFKECLPRQLYPSHDFVSTKMINDIFTIKKPKFSCGYQYIENLVMFDILPKNRKHIFYYEDLMTNKKQALYSFAPFLLPGQLALLDKLNWDEEFEKSLANYKNPMSGGKLNFHVNKLEDAQYLTRRVKELNPYIFDKYLQQYEN